MTINDVYSLINADGESRAVHVGMNTSFTFDIFICIAILKLHKKQVSKEMDAASVYGYLNR